MPKVYDIYNPTPARRVLYDGITNVKKIIVDSKATVTNVELADHIVKILENNARADGPENEVQLKEVEPLLKKVK